MEVSNELLAAYAKGNVSRSERENVRQYLIQHPDEMETVLMMMDDDYDLDLPPIPDKRSFQQRLGELLDELNL